MIPEPWNTIIGTGVPILSVVMVVAILMFLADGG